MSNITLENYPDLRDLTRSVSDDVLARVSSYIETVGAHFRPSTYFGSYVTSSTKGSGNQDNPAKASAAYTQFMAVFKEIANTPPISLDPLLPSAIEINYALPVVNRLTYAHSILTPAGEKRLTVTSPFRFVLTFPEYPFQELRRLAVARTSSDKLREFVLHYAVLNAVVMQNKRLLKLFEDLRFPIRSEKFEEFGALPITTITAPSGSVRPSDQLLSQVCRLSGTTEVEELADVEGWEKFPDPLAARFREEAAKFSVVVGGTAAGG